MRSRVIFVHGAFCGGWAFDAFRQPFEAVGYECLAPDLRGHAPGSTGASVVNVSMSDYASDIAALVATDSRPTILIGHSMGGLVAQMAATLVPVAALVMLAPSAPWGVAGASMEEAASAISLYSLGPFWAQSVAPDRAVARLYSLDRMAREEGRAVERRMTAESGRALFETLNWWLDPFKTTQVDPARIRAPVFAVAGGSDHIHPPSTVRQTAARLTADVQVFDGMSHWLIGEALWPEVAQASLDWLAGRLCGGAA